MTRRKLGKKAAVYLPTTKNLRKAIYNIEYPIAHNWGTSIDYPVWCNDTIGCCTQVSEASAVLTWTTNAQAPIKLTDEQVVQNYADESGYNGTPSTDNGAVEVDVLNRWMTTGYERPGQTRDYLTAFGYINPKAPEELKKTIYITGGVYIGINVPNYIMDSEQLPTIWDVQHSDAEIAGGHALFAHGYDEKGIYCNSWGEKVCLTYAFLSEYCDEAYGLISRENWVNVHAQTPFGQTIEEVTNELLS